MNTEHASGDEYAASVPPGTMIAISIGNTMTRVSLIEGLGVRAARVVSTDDASAIGTAAQDVSQLDGIDPPSGVLLASVDTTAESSAVSSVRAATGLDVQRFGSDVPIPIAMDVAEPSQVGHDRLLAALGAYATVEQACIIVDAGTAMTVDFVDGKGVFHGGSIIPGAQMMLDALHRHTDALPSVRLADMPDPLEPFGKTTEHAMLLGVRGAIRGSVRYLAERYADYYDAYPQIVATGGDAEMMLAGDELIESIVPDLILVGMAAARARLTADDPEAQPDHDD